MGSVDTGNVIPIASLWAVDRQQERQTMTIDLDAEYSETSRVDERRRDLQLLALALQLTESDEDEVSTLRSVFARLLDDVVEVAEAPASES